ncbi:MAG TPA: hypothetical protein VFA11_16930 [Acidimicrobiales bacterium]|nr:hypothetical protein [Acidimicrobiales bacterium]
MAEARRTPELPVAAGRVTESAIRIAVVHPELLGTYGDGGNAVILARRLEWRQIASELVEVHPGAPVPDSCDVYCLGGGEDKPQARAAAELSHGQPLARAVEAGAAVLAVCAGFQILGRSFLGADGTPRDGLGLIDAVTDRGRGRRAVGEVVSTPTAALGARGLPTLTGYENHRWVTTLGPGVTPLGQVVSGVGNGAGDRSEGAVSGRVVGTYMHGPVMARNPILADLILESVVGPLDPIEDAEANALRAERLAAVGAGGGARWGPLRRWGRRR